MSNFARKKLKRDFFARPTLKVARELLGKFLVVRNRSSVAGHRFPVLAGRIVETEAYIGPFDKACHAYWRKRQSCEVLWGPPGRLYVYLTYGLHWLINFVTEKDNYPSAVLVRALEPVAGEDQMWKNRRGVNKPYSSETSTINYQLSISNGPAKLTKALGIDGSFNGEDLIDSKRIWVEDRGSMVSPNRVVKSKRVGVDYAGEYKDKLWRFYIKNSPFVSKK
ncbi:MAG: DNA-3-methyladenine glycosylase [Patescibacteria group bacterium]|nr:DNA-3-methyladenine glycosylase [Patescibacteria group bacterium]